MGEQTNLWSYIPDRPVEWMSHFLWEDSKEQDWKWTAVKGDLSWEQTQWEQSGGEHLHHRGKSQNKDNNYNRAGLTTASTNTKHAVVVQTASGSTSLQLPTEKEDQAQNFPDF